MEKNNPWVHRVRSVLQVVQENRVSLVLQETLVFPVTQDLQAHRPMSLHSCNRCSLRKAERKKALDQIRFLFFRLRLDP